MVFTEMGFSNNLLAAAIQTDDTSSYRVKKSGETGDIICFNNSFAVLYSMQLEYDSRNSPISI